MQQAITTELIQACKKQNTQKQEELYNILYNDVYNLCYRHTENQDEAQDITQKIFIRIFTKIKQYKGEKQEVNISEERKFRAWAMKVARNIIYDTYKSKQKKQKFQEEYHASNKEKLLDEDYEFPEESISGKILMETLQELTPKYRMAINMYIIDGMEHKEIAKKLGISVGTSKSNLHRAKEQLKEKLLKKKWRRYD